MKRGYIPQNTSAAEVMQLIHKFEICGISVVDVSINQDFDSLAKSVDQGDTIIVSSYLSVFGSLTELLNRVLELWERAVVLESLSEPTVAATEKEIDYVKQLRELGTLLQASRTKKGLVRAKEQGKKLGRPNGSTKTNPNVLTAINLRKTSKISVEKACAIAGCKPRTYYRYLEQAANKEEE